MLKLIKVMLLVCVVFGIFYFVFMVPLGKKTFLEHMVGISETEEAKELEGELGKKVKGTVHELKKEISKTAADIAESEMKRTGLDGNNLASSKDEDSSKDNEEHSKDEKKKLGELIRKTAEPDNTDKGALNKLISDKSVKTD